MPTPKKAKPDKTRLKKEIEVVLRERARDLEAKVRSLELQLAKHENEHVKILRARNAAEDDAEVLLDGVRILAAQVTTDTAAGRRAREEARISLEMRKIRPPHTLGASRNRKSKKRRS